MHIQLKNGKMMNLTCVNNIRQGFKNKKVVIIELTNGLTLMEGHYDSESEASSRVEELKSSMI